MKKLYRIIVLHAAPKDSHKSTETYLVADSEQAVAEWIHEVKCGGYWWSDDEEEPSMRYDDNDKEIPFKDWLLLKRGDLEDDEGWEDAYYGVTKWGWEPVEGASPEDIDVLVRLGIAEVAA